MTKPKPLGSSELLVLRRLAFRGGEPEYKSLQDKSAMLILSRRGLIEDLKGPIPYITITPKGMAEVAKSGRFTPYDPKLLVSRYDEVVRLLKPTLSMMANRVVHIQDWIDLDKPWDRIVSLTYLRCDPTLWRSGLRVNPSTLISDVIHWLEVELSGNEESAKRLYEDLISEIGMVR